MINDNWRTAFFSLMSFIGAFNVATLLIMCFSVISDTVNFFTFTYGTLYATLKSYQTCLHDNWEIQCRFLYYLGFTSQFCSSWLRAIIFLWRTIIKDPMEVVPMVLRLIFIAVIIFACLLNSHILILLKFDSNASVDQILKCDSNAMVSTKYIFPIWQAVITGTSYILPIIVIIIFTILKPTKRRQDNSNKYLLKKSYVRCVWLEYHLTIFYFLMSTPAVIFFLLRRWIDELHSMKIEITVVVIRAIGQISSFGFVVAGPYVGKPTLLI